MLIFVVQYESKHTSGTRRVLAKSRRAAMAQFAADWLASAEEFGMVSPVPTHWVSGLWN